MEPYEKIAKILRVDKHNLKKIEENFNKLTGKSGVFDKIYKENGDLMIDRLNRLGLNINSKANEIFEVLIAKIDKDDKQLSKSFGNPCHYQKEGCIKIIGEVNNFIKDKKGLFLKKGKFIELLNENPPTKILQALGYENVSLMMIKEDWRQVASALRFFEGMSWMNEIFLPNYKKLNKKDFEYRDLEIIVLDEKWQELAKKFVEKKYHNISHLKELGIIFVIPILLNIPGELIRSLALIFHYYNEVRFYSSLFEFFLEKENFSDNLISLLRGDVIEERSEKKDGDWLIVQRYLAKDDENDWRLFEPHINPEALHWEKAERMFVDFAKSFDGLKEEFEFWAGLNWVGEYFKTETGVDILVSFNLIDTSMSLVKSKEMVKYLYHHQESLWNKIYCEYFSEEIMEKNIVENIIKRSISFS